MHNLSKCVQTRAMGLGCSTGTGAGTTGTAIDMAGFDSLLVCLSVVNTTATATLQLRGSTASNGTFVNLASASAATTAAGILQVDLYRPTYRFINTLVTSTGTADVLGAPIGLMYNARALPTSNNSTDVRASAIVSHATT